MPTSANFPSEDFTRLSTQADSNVNQPENSLEETAQQEHEYLRQKLRDELQREPTEQETDEWLRQHTEGY